MKKFENKILFYIVLIGAINWGALAIFKLNIVTTLLSKIPNLHVDHKSHLERIIYILVAISAIMLVTQRDFRLPFLGETVFPCNSLPNSIPYNADTKVSVQVKPNSKVVYWAAKGNPDTIFSNPWDAYGDNSNYGVTTSDNNGVAVFSFRYPPRYRVPSKGLLNPHVHYRVCLGKGMMSRIHTLDL